jgi:hypothetical protein
VDSMRLFHSPDEPCYGGRQAFSGSKDIFYDALRAVSGKAQSIAAQYDRRPTREGELPRTCVLAFPIIVVEGRLFESGLDRSSGETFVREVQGTRIHWRGSQDRPQITTVDVISFDAFDEFAITRYRECSALLDIMLEKHPQFVALAKTRDPNSVSLSGGSTGMATPPKLFYRQSKMD